MYLKKKLIHFSEILLLGLPLAILSGPFLPDLFISIIVLIFLSIVVIEKNWKYLLNPFSIFFISFIFILIITSISSNFIYLSLESSLFYFRFYFFSLAVWFLLDKNANLSKKFTIVLFSIFLIALFSGYYQYNFGYNIFGIVSNSNARLTLLFNEKLYMGGYIARLFPLLVGLLILNFSSNKYRKLNVLVTFILLILTDVLIFISGERTALGLLLISTVAFIIFLSNLKSIRVFSLIVSIIIITFVSINFPSIKERNVNHTLKQLGITSDEYSPRHLPMYKSAWNIYLDNLYIGTGPKTYRKVCLEDRYNFGKFTCNTHPHNTYLQVMSETGTLGLLFFIIAMFYVGKNLIFHLISIFFNKKIHFDDYQICLLICFLLTLWPFQPSMNIFNNWINIIYYLPLGFYLHSLNQNKLEN